MNAVLEAEHVSDLVHHCVAGSLEPYLFLLFWRPLRVTFWVPLCVLVPIEGEDATSFAHVSETKDKVEIIVWVYVDICDS